MSRQDKRVKYETQEHGQMDFFQNDVSVMHRHSMSDANEMDLFRTFAESMNNNSDYTSPNMFNDGGHQQNYPRECKAVNTPIYVEPQRSHVQIQVHPMIIQNLPLGHYLTDPFQMVGHFDGNNKTIKPEPSHQHSGMNDMEKMHWNFSENDDNGCFNSVQDADEEHQHSGGGRGGGDKPTKVAKDRRRERNKVLARKTRVKKKAELEILREKMLSLVCESKRLKSVITAYLPEPLALRVFQQSDSHLPENILSIVQQVITRQEKSLFEDLKMQQRSFCIMNATVPDMPIIYASVDFYKLTGYPTEEVIGKNCRILQGPETNRTETARIRRALESGRDIIAVLLNYKKDGTKFWNQIQMAHMKDINEAPSLILGIQSQVSPAMSPPLSGRASSGQIDRGTANAIDALLQQRTRDSQQAAAQQGHTKEKTSNAITNGNSSSSSGGNTTSELITNNTASHSTSSYASVNGTLAKGGVKGNVRKSRSKEAAASTFTDSLAATHSTLSVDPPTTESTAASAFQTACLPSSLSPPCSSLNSSSSRWGVSGVRSNVVLLLKEQNTQPGLGSALLAKAPPSLTRFLKEEQAEKKLKEKYEMKHEKDSCSSDRSSGNGSGSESMKNPSSSDNTTVERGTSVNSSDSDKTHLGKRGRKGPATFKNTFEESSPSSSSSSSPPTSVGPASSQRSKVSSTSNKHSHSSITEHHMQVGQSAVNCNGNNIREAPIIADSTTKVDRDRGHPNFDFDGDDLAFFDESMP